MMNLGKPARGLVWDDEHWVRVKGRTLQVRLKGNSPNKINVCTKID